MKMDFHRAGISHLLWKRKIRSMMDGKEEFSSSEAISPRHCELGRWLYGYGIRNFSDLSEIIELEKLHVEMHNSAQRIIEYIRKGTDDAAEREYANLDETSKKIIILLTTLSVKIGDT